MLDNLVLCFLSTSPNNKGIAGAKDGDGIFADVAEPNVSQCAGSWTVLVAFTQ
jgi:hypothetical protein